MAVTVAKYRLYGAFSAAETDAELETTLDAAKESLLCADVPERQRSPLYDLTVYQLALDMHDNRGARIEGSAGIPYGLQSAVHQLRGLPPEEEASGA